MPYVAHPDHHKKWCEHHKFRYVLLRTHSGYCIDGFIEHIDDHVVCLAVPAWPHDDRAFFGPGFYPYPFFPRRRFYRQVFPLGGLLGLSLLPFFF
ncbi:hypothetical protein ET464_07735 [Paenibacillus protaetiae]|uniref:Uncharacterized protein n=2 Tax=Paenibacillus protaetiae TaxID=2509456 RepID=A0A4P6EZ52_9BACL|nr:hypothetical protein ET464_07735 [Paenibacillus protaetiae]